MVELHSNMNNVTVIHLPGSRDGELNDKNLRHTNDSCQLICDRFLAKSNDNKDYKDYFNFLGRNLSNAKNGYENLRCFYSPTHDIYFHQQNVGIAGRVSMASNAALSMEEDNVGPYSLVSVHETIVESYHSSQHFTTVTIEERDSLQRANKKLTCSKSCVADTDEGNDITSTKEETHELKKTAKSVASLVSSGSQTEPVKPPTMHQESQVSLDEMELLKSKFKEITHTKLPQHNISQEMNFETSSPPSSYSSAYTLTEHELMTSDASTSPSVPNGYDDCGTGETISDPWSDESGLENMWVSDDKKPRVVKTTKIVMDNDLNPNMEILSVPLHHLPHESSFSNKSNEGSPPLTVSQHRYEEREKGEDEIWVANEATDSCTRSDYAFQWIPSPLSSSQQENKPQFQHCKRMKLHLPTSAISVSVPPDQRVSVHAENGTRVTMTALMPPVCDVTLQRRHFTNRQRIIEVSPSTEQQKGTEKEIKEATWNKENVLAGDKDNLQTSILTSTIANRPTKRFSFLVRSNSLRNEEDTPQQVKDDPKKSSPKVLAGGDQISPSDKAILDRLSKLNLLQSPSNTIKPRLMSGTSQPPCGRCGEPVYPQELIRPTAELFFHSTCFKCYQCGLRLNLRTFYRSPSHTKDNRVFCRIHLPPTDVRPTYPQSKQNLKADHVKEIVKCDSVGLRYF